MSSEAREAALLPSPLGPAGKNTKQYTKRVATPVHLAEVPSVNPNAEFDALARLDPFHGGLWRGGAGAWWTSYVDMATRQTRWLSAPKHWTRLTPERATEMMMSPRNRADLIRMCAVLLAWRNCTAQQLAALTGSRKLLGDGTLMRDAFVAGLIDIGAMPSPVGHDRDGLGLMVRLSRATSDRVWREVIEPELTWTEWVAATGGLGWDTSGQYDRHNVLTTELGIRVAERLPIGQVLGERFSSHRFLAHGMPGYRPEDVGGAKESTDRRGDLLIVRKDGLRIVVELTATAKGAEHKARNWANLMLKAPMELTGFVVLFLCAVDPLNTSLTPQASLSDVAVALSRVTREVPGAVGNWTPDRFALAEWTEWFPGEGLVSEEFLTMAVRQPTGPPDDPWEDASLLDLPLAPSQGPASSHFDPAALLRNSAMLANGPHWLRPELADPEDELWPYLFNGEIEDFIQVDPERPDLANGRPRHEPASPPARLLVGNKRHVRRKGYGG